MWYLLVDEAILLKRGGDNPFLSEYFVKDIRRMVHLILQRVDSVCYESVKRDGLGIDITGKRGAEKYGVPLMI